MKRQVDNNVTVNSNNGEGILVIVPFDYMLGETAIISMDNAAMEGETIVRQAYYFS